MSCASSDPRPERLAQEPAPGLAEERLAGEEVFSGRLLKIQRDDARTPDGLVVGREYTLHPGASAVLAFLPSGRLLLERQWRYPMNRSFIEIPAGKIDAGEDPLHTAIRELREETGYTAAEWAVLGPMHPVISYSTEVIHIYAARGLVAGPRQLDAGEALDLVEMSTDEFLLAAESGKISDAKTLAAAFFLARMQTGHLQPQWRPAP